MLYPGIHFGSTKICLEHPLFPKKGKMSRKCRVNDDPCDLEKWSILNFWSTSLNEFYIGGKKTINAALF